MTIGLGIHPPAACVDPVPVDRLQTLPIASIAA
jgi:hypothetical protein